MLRERSCASRATSAPRLGSIPPGISFGVAPDPTETPAMSVCAAMDCDRDAFIFELQSTVGLCYEHWRSLWTKTNFYDPSGRPGVPVDLKDGRRLRLDSTASTLRADSGLADYDPSNRPATTRGG
jgi:hypothetical protein